MVAITDHNKRVAPYFRAWSQYDFELLRSIFSPDARYIIRRKKTYYGIDEIIGYWKHNKRRQKNINLHWRIKESSSRFEIVTFGAYFWDMESNLYTKINGEIIFEFNTDNKISLLTEAYKKRTVPRKVKSACAKKSL